VTKDTLERMAREIGADLPLPAEDWAAVVGQVQRILEAVRSLDELPLDAVEPAPIYRINP